MESTQNKSTRRRVKFYHLSDKGDWEDKGTGHVECLYLEVTIYWLFIRNMFYLTI